MQKFFNSRNPLLLCLLSLSALALVSCGGSGGGTTDSNPPMPPNTDPAVSTTPPGDDDEPLVEDAEFNNAVGFDVVREPGPRLPVKDEAGDVTESDFAAGLPEPVIQIPEGIDPSTNQAPFFEDLENVEVVAGEILEVVYRPQDAEGELPGMFPEKLPQGASFDDNFDGSKTFRWQPLQNNVGFLKFTVTALDPVNQLYRSSQSIIIKTVLPEDPSSIPNVAPMLDTVIPHTVRVNDPVVFELKGIDLNGTVPILEINDLPAGGSFLIHPRFEEIYVLKFVPDTVGQFEIEVVARDSVDASLTNTETVSITVLSEDDFELASDSLRVLAQNRDIKIGFAALQSFYHRPDGAIYAATAAREFNIVTPENSMKMEHLNPEPGRYQFAATDNLVTFANLHDMTVHGHPLVWYRQLPEWVQNSEIEDRETHMIDYISRVMARYSNDVPIWDVVNEPMDDDGSLRDSVWLEAMGAEYIDTAFNQARLMSADATLLINEFDIGFEGPKFTGLMSLVDDLQAREIPLDGIGFQLHLFTSFDQFDELRANFEEVASRDLDIYITELDVSLVDGATSEEQAEGYAQITAICLEQVRCKAIQTWGLTDQYSFRSIFDPLPFDRAYQAKPAYNAISDTLTISGN